MAQRKYVSLSKLSTFLDNLKNTFASLTHKHTINDITDFSIDNALSSTSTNPLQNKIVNAQFEAVDDLIYDVTERIVSQDNTISSIESTLLGKANTNHGTHVTFSTTSPLMDGDASVGSGSTVARSNHVHPTDTSRASKTEFDTHTANTTVHITSTERSNWNDAKTKADAAYNMAANRVDWSGLMSTLSDYYTKTEIDNLELITVEDIDTICGAAIQVASLSEVTF